MKTLIRLVLLVLFVAGWTVLTAAAGDAASIANALATAVVILSPFVLKFVKLDGPTMVAVSYVAALVIGAAALLLSGEAKLDISSAPSVLAFATALWGLQQLVFQIFKDHPAAAPLLK